LAQPKCLFHLGHGMHAHHAGEYIGTLHSTCLELWLPKGSPSGAGTSECER
jgi:hypothetical protein